MSKRNRLKRRNDIEKKEIYTYQGCNFSKEEMIEIYSEAYYRAAKRLEAENNSKEEGNAAKTKRSVMDKILYFINVLLWPIHISKRFKVNGKYADSIIVMVLTGMFMLVGISLWFGSLGGVIVTFVNGDRDFLQKCCDGWLYVFWMFFGAIFWQAGKEIYNEQDSNKLYAYTSSFMAIISVIISTVALIISLNK